MYLYLFIIGLSINLSIVTTLPILISLYSSVYTNFFVIERPAEFSTIKATPHEDEAVEKFTKK